MRHGTVARGKTLPRSIPRAGKLSGISPTLLNDLLSRLGDRRAWFRQWPGADPTSADRRVRGRENNASAPPA